jgi:hypothetical protein|tara:strand:+ start:1341 stop:1511 length:171 start_codon:yes stop_codon:yes gene_type:complete
MTTFTHGTTLEIFENRGHKTRLVCCPGGGMCRYAKDEYEAEDFARMFEEFFEYHCA